MQILFLLAHIVFRPYRVRDDNITEGAALVVLALTTTILNDATFPLEGFQAVGIGILVFVPAAVLLGIILFKRAKVIENSRLTEVSRTIVRAGDSKSHPIWQALKARD